MLPIPGQTEGNRRRVHAMQRAEELPHQSLHQFEERSFTIITLTRFRHRPSEKNTKNKIGETVHNNTLDYVALPQYAVKKIITCRVGYGESPCAQYHQRL